MTYQSTNLLARTNPLRSTPFLRPASILVRVPLPTRAAPMILAAAPDRAYQVLTPNELLATALANAEADCARSFGSTTSPAPPSARQTAPARHP